MSWEDIGKEKKDEEPKEVAPEVSRFIVIVWIGPHDPPLKCIESWATFHPASKGWGLRLVRNDQGWLNQKVIDAVSDLGAKADMIRFEILEMATVPTICVDADVECTQALDALNASDKPITDFFTSPAFASFESEVVKPGLISTAFMGGMPGAAFWRKCVDEVAKVDPATLKAAKIPAELVGSGLLTRVAQGFAKDKFVVHPSRVVNYEYVTGVKSPARGAAYGLHRFGTAKTYNTMRQWPCNCAICRAQAPSWRPSWG